MMGQARGSARRERRGVRGVGALATLTALLAVLAVPVAAEEPAAGAWPQRAADPQNTNRAAVDGPSDPGLRWAVDLEAIETDEAPEGYAAGGLSAVHSPILAADGVVVVPASNPGLGGRDAFVALDPDTGEVAWEIQRRLHRCGPAVDSQGRLWAGLRFDHDDAFSSPTVRAFDADGEEIADTAFDLGELGGGNADRWCGIDTSLHLVGEGDDERMILFRVESGSADIAALDLSGTTPTVAWRIGAEDVDFDRFADASVGGFGGGSSARLAAMTDEIGRAHVWRP